MFSMLDADSDISMISCPVLLAPSPASHSPDAISRGHVDVVAARRGCHAAGARRIYTGGINDTEENASRRLMLIYRHICQAIMLRVLELPPENGTLRRAICVPDLTMRHYHRHHARFPVRGNMPVRIRPFAVLPSTAGNYALPKKPQTKCSRKAVTVKEE